MVQKQLGWGMEGTLWPRLGLINDLISQKLSWLLALTEWAWAALLRVSLISRFADPCEWGFVSHAWVPAFAYEMGHWDLFVLSWLAGVYTVIVFLWSALVGYRSPGCWIRQPFLRYTWCDLGNMCCTAAFGMYQGQLILYDVCRCFRELL